MLTRPCNLAVGNAMRISVGLLFIVVSALGLSYTVGLLPSHDKLRTQRQLDLARSLAIQFSAAIENRDPKHVQELAGSTTGSVSDVASIGLRSADGRLVFAADGHESRWRAASAGDGKAQPVTVSLYDRDKLWGQLELLFHAQPTSFRSGTMGFIIYVSLSCLLGFLFFMKRTLRVLDPSQVIPERVRAMLDTLAEGAVIVGGDGRIVLANESLARLLNTTSQKLLGTALDELPFKLPAHEPGQPAGAADVRTLPWARIAGDLHCRGQMVQLDSAAGLRSVIVNASSIQGGRGSVRGYLFTFDDVTAVEQKNRQLVEMVDQLGQAQQRVQRQNEDLRRLATRDPLTDCLNRRTFHEQADTLFALASRQQQPLSVIMVDVDHFKHVNDTHGHARGDEVLKGVARTLGGPLRASDVVCRHGGEEFCILLPSTDLDGAFGVAEKLRQAVASTPIVGLTVTASFGVSCSTLGATSAPLLIDQADQALYNSKRASRNRTTRFDRLDPSLPAKAADRQPDARAADEQIPVHAVRSLLAALAFRDPQTAEHSRRVSELCVKAGAAWLDSRELHILETAALLHDVGKVGVPDSVLLKPGPLTEEEWRLMRQHDRIGLEIIQTAFSCPQMASIIAHHHAQPETAAGSVMAPSDQFIPMCARLLGIADAYDAMTTHRVYRVARSREEAFAELRRCAGSQFDPLLVEHFINTISASSAPDSSEKAPDRLAHVLRLGMEAEMMASALLNRDLEATVALASHLAQVATAMGSEQLSQRCQRMVSSIESASDMQTLLTEARGVLNAVAIAPPVEK